MNAKLPYPHFLDVTPIVVNITEGIDGNGVPAVVLTYSGNCRYYEKAKTIRDADGKLIQLEGKVTIGCDIAPTVTLLKGHVTINGREMKIYKGKRPRNPDGSVNHTVLELI